MHFSTEQLDALADNGVPRPTRLNDDIRRDMGAEPFLAIDPAHKHEVDDAIRVKRLRTGGFLLEVAIADGSQLAPFSPLTTEAIEQGRNIYQGRWQHKAILPYGLVKELELSGREAQRALIISEEFDASGAPQDKIDVFPGRVNVEVLSHANFGHVYLRDLGRKALNAPIVAFNRAFRQNHGFNYHEPDVLGGTMRVQDYGATLVLTCMTLANGIFAHWAREENVPIIYRDFVPGKSAWNTEGATGETTAAYTAVATQHVGVSRYSGEDSVYTHATSPLRRSVDIINHLQAGHHKAGYELPFSQPELEMYATHLNQASPRTSRKKSREPVILDQNEVALG